MSHYISEDMTLLLSNIEDKDYNILCSNIIETVNLLLKDRYIYLHIKMTNGDFHVMREQVIDKFLKNISADHPNANILIEFKLKGL